MMKRPAIEYSCRGFSGRGGSWSSGYRWLWYAVGFASLLSAGCAGMLTADSPGELKQKVVLERARARWDAVAKGDAKAAYEFLSTGSKAQYSVAVYEHSARFKGYKSVDVESAECGAEECLVKARVTLESARAKGLPLPLEVTETWVLEKGQYWYVWRK
jgi:hypothetical protein